MVPFLIRRVPWQRGQCIGRPFLLMSAFPRGILPPLRLHDYPTLSLANTFLFYFCSYPEQTYAISVVVVSKPMLRSSGRIIDSSVTIVISTPLPTNSPFRSI